MNWGRRVGSEVLGSGEVSVRPGPHSAGNVRAVGKRLELFLHLLLQSEARTGWAVPVGTPQGLALGSGGTEARRGDGPSRGVQFGVLTWSSFPYCLFISEDSGLQRVKKRYSSCTRSAALLTTDITLSTLPPIPPGKLGTPSAGIIRVVNGGEPSTGIFC